MDQVLCVPDLMVAMGYCREDISDSLSNMKYDDITATYLLLGCKVAEVRDCRRGYSSLSSFQFSRVSNVFVKVEVNDAASGGALLGICPTSRGQSPAHLPQRGSASSSTSSKQRRYSEQGRRGPAGRCTGMAR